MTSTETDSPNDGTYQVVALRYRPQAFGDLVGQGHIATALSNAIKQGRVGHAYLFTGARGVGKTSSARIFAKCLNCVTGPTTTPCNECDICEAVSTGEDIDVLEIDGASNRGIDEIRQLRSNAAIRPSRGRYKIYIIDEVHMLTSQAFNALLKTLEEPPGHVKFIFCTTDPQKIPITVLSRCQRFDFSPVQPDKIADRLREIATAEGVTVDEPALALLARRANGSMRDSQSLLEQLFSFCEKTISVAEVHQLLGTSDIARIAEVAAAMAAKDSSATLGLIHQSISQGSDPGQTTEQLLGYFRDMMAARVGCGEETMLNCSAADMAGLQQLADQLGLETILASVQVLDEALVRMQTSLHARTLLEVAAIRVCNLQHLDSIGDLIESLSATGRSAKKVAVRGTTSTAVAQPTKPPVKKNEIAEPAVVSPAVVSAPKAPEPAAVVSSPVDPPTALVEHVAEEKPVHEPSVATSSVVVTNGVGDNRGIESTWKQALDAMGDMTSDMASHYERVELKSPDNLVVTMWDAYNSDKCSRAERKQKLESALAEAAGRPIRIDFVVSANAKKQLAPAPKLSRNQQIRKLQENDFVKQTIDMFDAEVVGFFERRPR